MGEASVVKWSPQPFEIWTKHLLTVLFGQHPEGVYWRMAFLDENFLGVMSTSLIITALSLFLLHSFVIYAV